MPSAVVTEKGGGPAARPTWHRDPKLKPNYGKPKSVLPPTALGRAIIHHNTHQDRCLEAETRLLTKQQRWTRKLCNRTRKAFVIRQMIQQHVIQTAWHNAAHNKLLPDEVIENHRRHCDLEVRSMFYTGGKNLHLGTRFHHMSIFMKRDYTGEELFRQSTIDKSTPITGNSRPTSKNAANADMTGKMADKMAETRSLPVVRVYNFDSTEETEAELVSHGNGRDNSELADTRTSIVYADSNTDITVSHDNDSILNSKTSSPIIASEIMNDPNKDISMLNDLPDTELFRSRSTPSVWKTEAAKKSRKAMLPSPESPGLYNSRSLENLPHIQTGYKSKLAMERVQEAILYNPDNPFLYRAPPTVIRSPTNGPLTKKQHNVAFRISSANRQRNNASETKSVKLRLTQAHWKPSEKLEYDEIAQYLQDKAIAGCKAVIDERFIALERSLISPREKSEQKQSKLNPLYLVPIENTEPSPDSSLALKPDGYAMLSESNHNAVKLTQQERRFIRNKYQPSNPKRSLDPDRIRNALKKAKSGNVINTGKEMFEHKSVTFERTESTISLK